MKRYAVREVFDTIQGEGARAGSRAVFVRFAGCNLWNGLPADRHKGLGACAAWCDTDFHRGEQLTVEGLLEQMASLWTRPVIHGRWTVLTGGEPSLQVDDQLLDAFRSAHWQTAMETNGRRADFMRGMVDWLTVSPKLARDGSYVRPAVLAAEEVKVVLPGVDNGCGWTEDMLDQLERDVAAEHYYVQPMDPLNNVHVLESTFLRDRANVLLPAYSAGLQACIAFVKRHPNWRLGLQLHKFAGLP